MYEYIYEIKDMLPSFDDKQLRKLKIPSFINLMNKLEDNCNDEIKRMIVNTIEELRVISKNILHDKSIYLKMLKTIKKQVRKEYGYIEKGTLKNEYLAMGIGFGLLFSALSIFDKTLIGIGLPLGFIIGSFAGTKKELAAQKEGKLY